MMNKIIILLATVVIVVYGKCCSSNVSIHTGLAIHNSCNKSNTDCHNAVNNFTTAAKAGSLKDNLVYINRTYHKSFTLKESEESENVHSDVFDKIFREFKIICQTYTDVMAHKYYLQHELFKGTNDGPTVMVKLVSVIMSLEFMANALQTAQMQNDNNFCVTFTPYQYGRIYNYSRLKANKTNAIDWLLCSIFTWRDRKNLIRNCN